VGLEGVAEEAIAAKTAGKLVSVLMDGLEAGQLPMKLSPDLGDTLTAFDESGGGLARLVGEVQAWRIRNASQLPKKPRNSGDFESARPELKVVMLVVYVVWYTCTTLALISLTVNNGVWIYLGIVALVYPGTHALSGELLALVLAKLFVSGAILTLCLHFLWNRLMWLLGRRNW
jgi:hypothetical protein